MQDLLSSFSAHLLVIVMMITIIIIIKGDGIERYGDSVQNTRVENSIVFFII